MAIGRIFGDLHFLRDLCQTAAIRRPGLPCLRTHVLRSLDLAALPADTLDLVIFMSPEPLSAPSGSGPATFPDAALRGRATVHSL